MTLQMMVSMSWPVQHEPGLENSFSSTASGLHLARARAAWDAAVVLSLLGGSASMGAWWELGSQGNQALLFSVSLNVQGGGIRNYVFFPDPFLSYGSLSSLVVVAAEGSLCLIFPEGFVMVWDVMSGK